MDLWGILGGASASAFWAIVVLVGFWAVGVYVALRILYSVIWRAVRRGLREYHGAPAAAAQTAALYPPRWTAPPKHTEPRAPKRPAPIREQPGPRDWKPGGSLFE